jgi:transcriptional regulator with XRE-family HTH domain
MKQTNNFGTNLLSLCKSDQSFAHICRELGINRQQFNKYKSGQHLPSRRNIAAISAYFGVSEKDLFLEPVAFNRIYGSRDNAMLRIANYAAGFRGCNEAVKTTADRIRDIVGVHLRYQISSIYAGRVLRSVQCFYVRDGLLFYDYVERFNSLDIGSKHAFTFRYRGVCTFLDGKLYMFDLESAQQNEHTFAIMTPIARKPREFIFGITSGVAASMSREAFATRLALRKVDNGPLRPSHVRQGSTLPFDSEEIPAEVRNYLDIAGGGQGRMLRGA